MSFAPAEVEEQKALYEIAQKAFSLKIEDRMKLLHDDQLIRFAKEFNQVTDKKVQNFRNEHQNLSSNDRNVGIEAIKNTRN